MSRSLEIRPGTLPIRFYKTNDESRTIVGEDDSERVVLEATGRRFPRMFHYSQGSGGFGRLEVRDIPERDSIYGSLKNFTQISDRISKQDSLDPTLDSFR